MAFRRFNVLMDDEDNVKAMEKAKEEFGRLVSFSTLLRLLVRRYTFGLLPGAKTDAKDVKHDERGSG